MSLHLKNMPWTARLVRIGPFQDGYLARAAVIDSTGKNIIILPATDEGKAMANVFAASPLMYETLLKANTCASIPDYVKELIQEAIAAAQGQSK